MSPLFSPFPRRRPFHIIHCSQSRSPAASASPPPPSSKPPVYNPTPLNRDFRTPHSGYHFDGTTREFFEGWYFKVSIPECRQSFCFVYSMENPVFPNGMGMSARVEVYRGRSAILGADDKYICQYTEVSKNFWASKCFHHSVEC